LVLRRKCLPTPGVNDRNIPGYCSQVPTKRIILPFFAIWVSEGFFSGDANCGIFPWVAKKIFPQGAKSGKILFYPLETKISIFFAKNVIGKCQTSTSRALVLPSALPTPMNMGHYLLGVERVKRFVNLRLHCIVSNLKTMSKMSMFAPLEKFLRMPMVIASAISSIVFFDDTSWRSSATALLVKLGIYFHRYVYLSLSQHVLRFSVLLQQWLTWAQFGWGHGGRVPPLF